MRPRHAIRFGGAGLLAIGVMLLVATGTLATALGALRGDAVTGGTDPSSMAFWFQLAFMRLFGTAAIALGLVLIWCGAHLTDIQQGSLVRVLRLTLGALAVMAVGQQVAIWNSSAGWALAGALLLIAGASAVSTFAGAARRAA